MLDFYNALPLTDKLFLYSSIFGGAFFFLKTFLSLIGSDHDGHGDIDSGVDGHDGAVTHDGSDTISDFHLLTIQGLTAFFMLGGLAGLFFSRSLELGVIAAIPAAAIAGFIALYCNALLVRVLGSLQSSGTLDMNNALDQEGQVYLTVKSQGGGQVQIEIQGRSQIFDAITESADDIPTGSRVLVYRIVNNSTLMVSKL